MQTTANASIDTRQNLLATGLIHPIAKRDQAFSSWIIIQKCSCHTQDYSLQ